MSATNPLPTPEQEQRAKWDLLLADLEYRAEQIRQVRVYEPWRLVFSGALAGAAIVAATATITTGVLRFLH